MIKFNSKGWTTGKKVAHVIKAAFAPKPISTVEPEAYARQFLEDAEKRFIARLKTQGKESDAGREVGGTSLSPVTPAGVAIEIAVEGDVGNEAGKQGVQDNKAGARTEEGVGKSGNNMEAAKAEGVVISLVPGSHAGLMREMRLREVRGARMMTSARPTEMTWVKPRSVRRNVVIMKALTSLREANTLQSKKRFRVMAWL